MKIAAAIIALLCGIAVLVGIFLPWAEGEGPLGILISLGAAVAIGGLAWFFVDMSSVDNWMDYVGYGTYICGGGAVLGLIFGALASVKR
jgi:hypothetical protein